LSFPLVPPSSSLSFGQESSLFVLGIVSFRKVFPWRGRIKCFGIFTLHPQHSIIGESISLKRLNQILINGSLNWDFYFLQFVFMIRCYNTYVESVISKFESAEQKPDVLIANSCLWDITRYGDRPVPEYTKFVILRHHDHFQQQL
jgi:hypothetical protein